MEDHERVGIDAPPRNEPCSVLGKDICEEYILTMGAHHDQD